MFYFCRPTVGIFTMKRKAEKDITYNLIIDTALPLFLEKGFEKTSIEEICRTCNLSKGGFYHHFKSKDELLFAVSARLGEAIIQITQQADAYQNPIDGLVFYIQSYLTYYNDHPKEAAFFMVLMNRSASSPAMQEFYLTSYLEVSGFLSFLYQKAIEQELMEEFDTVKVATALMTSLDGMTGYFQVIGHKLELSEVIETYKTAFILPYLKNQSY